MKNKIKILFMVGGVAIISVCFLTLYKDVQNQNNTTKEDIKEENSFKNILAEKYNAIDSFEKDIRYTIDAQFFLKKMQHLFLMMF